MKTKYISLALLFFVLIGCKVDKENSNSDANSTEKTESSKATGAGFKVSFNALVDKDDAFQLFYNEDGTESFTGEQMVEFKLKGSNEPQNIEFLLPDDAMPLNFRFDIGSNKDLKEVKFNKFKMEYNGKVFECDAATFFKYFYPNDQVVLDTVNTVAKTVGKKDAPFDPIIGGTLHLRNELEKFYQK